jgi:hypothetical protein
VIELVRNGLHGADIETLGVEHDRERIAGEAAVGEYVKRDETPAHEGSSSSLVAKCDPLRRAIAPRHHIRWATKTSLGVTNSS